MNKFARKMDYNLYYVASLLDPRIKSCEVDHPRPTAMSETMWRTLRKVQPCKEASLSDIDKYLDSPPVNWSHHMIGDADAEWVLKWWKANAFNFPLMAKAARDYLPIPSAEVGIEREFSIARDVLGLRRHRLNAETAMADAIEKKVLNINFQ